MTVSSSAGGGDDTRVVIDFAEPETGNVPEASAPTDAPARTPADSPASAATDVATATRAYAEVTAVPAQEDAAPQTPEAEAGVPEIPAPPQQAVAADGRGAELVATATPDGVLTLTAAAMEGFIPADEADRLAREAYIRGRNEAIEARWGELRPEASADTTADPSDAPDALADIFTLRRSVWN